MKLLFDARWLEDGPPSGQRVVSNLIRSWTATYPEDNLAVCVNRTSFQNFSSQGSSIDIVSPRIRQHGVSNMLEIGRLSHGFDATICQNFSALFGSTPCFVLIHDLMFKEHPEWFTHAERLYFSMMVKSARRSHGVMTTSYAEKRRIERLCPHLGEVAAVGLGVPSEFESAVQECAEGVPPSFLLAVGRLNKRKNLGTLLTALQEHSLVSPARPLLVVGSRDGAQENLDSFGNLVQNRSVRFLGKVSDSTLSYLYTRAACFIFPSLDEGFGIPIIEALSKGAKVAVSDIPAFREIAGEEAFFFDPHDPSSIARTVAEAMRGSTGVSRWTDSSAAQWRTVVERMRGYVREKLASDDGD